MINRQKAKQLIRQLLHAQDKLIHYGGCEQAPIMWKEYLDVRVKLFKEMELPLTKENKVFLDMPYGDKRMNGSNRFVSFGELVAFIADASQTMDFRLENHIEWLYDVLLEQSEMHEARQPYDVIKLLEYARKTKMPTADVILLLGIEDLPYTRFLINIIWYNGYAPVKHVADELELIKQPDIEFSLIMFGSPILTERQQGKEWLRNTDLEFIDAFLWWEEESHLYYYNFQNHTDR